VRSSWRIAQGADGDTAAALELYPVLPSTRKLDLATAALTANNGCAGGWLPAGTSTSKLQGAPLCRVDFRLPPWICIPQVTWDCLYHGSAPLETRPLETPVCDAVIVVRLRRMTCDAYKTCFREVDVKPFSQIRYVTGRGSGRRVRPPHTICCSSSARRSAARHLRVEPRTCIEPFICIPVRSRSLSLLSMHNTVLSAVLQGPNGEKCQLHDASTQHTSIQGTRTVAFVRSAGNHATSHLRVAKCCAWHCLSLQGLTRDTGVKRQCNWYLLCVTLFCVICMMMNKSTLDNTADMKEWRKLVLLATFRPF
jgi:hypothetical protein